MPNKVAVEKEATKRSVAPRSSRTSTESSGIMLVLREGTVS